MANLIDDIIRNAEQRPDAVALRHGEDATTSYPDLRDACLAFAQRLRDRGVHPGDRVLLCCPSVDAYVVAYMGVQAAGGAIVAANTMATRDELAYFLSDSGAKLAIGWHENGPGLQEACDETGTDLLVLTEYDAARPHSLDSAALADLPIDRADDDLAALLYTSGTTGKPKGTQLTVGGLSAAIDSAIAASRMGAEDRCGTALPLFHCFGQVAGMLPTLRGGGSLTLLHPLTLEGQLSMIPENGLTVMLGVPTMWMFLLYQAGEEGVGAEHFSTLKYAVSGGAPLPESIITRFEDELGVTVLEGYGLTETAAMGTFSQPGGPRKVGFVGSPVQGIELSVRDFDGRELGPDEPGEVFLRGSQITTGYWNRPADTDAAISKDGWFRTGDIGLRDADGDLRIVDRVKDMIIRGGYNVYPAEVEAILHQNPAVLEAAVIGVPDEKYGEEVAACVVIKPGEEVAPEDLESLCREHLSAYKVPRLISFVEQLPKGATGKTLKRGIDRAEVLENAWRSESALRK